MAERMLGDYFDQIEYGEKFDHEYIDDRVTLNGRPLTTDDVEVLLDEEEHR